MRGRAVYWAAFGLLAAVMVYGFWSGGLFRQEVWSPLGLERLGWFLAVYAAWVALARLLFWRWFVPATAAAALAYTAAVTGIGAPVAVAFFLLSAWSLGIARGVLGILAGLVVYAALVGVAVHFPVNYPAVYAAVLAAPMVWRWRRIVALRPRWMAPGWQTVLLAMALLMQWLVALKPEVSSDGLAMHLAVPASVAAHHRFVFDFRETLWALMPMAADWCFTAVYLLGGEYAARLFNWAMLAAIASLLGGLVRPLLVALLVASPVTQLVSGSLFVENFWTALLLGAFVAHRAQPYLAALLLGGGLATKVGTLAFALPLAIPLARRAPAALLVFLAFGLPPYIHAWARSGNPVYPFLDPALGVRDVRFQERLRPTTLYDVTFHTDRFLEARKGGWAFQYLLLLPLGALALRRNMRTEWTALGVGGAFFALAFAVQPNARYLYPALPLFSIVAEGALGRSRLMAGVAVALFALNIYFLPASGWYHRDFYLAGDRERYLEISAPGRRLVEHLNRAHPGERALFVESNQVAGLRGPALTTTWHHLPFWRELRAVESARDCLALLNRAGVRNLVAPVEVERITSPALRRVVAEVAAPEHRFGAWQAVRLPEDYVGARGWQTVRLMEQGLWPVPPGVYDDMSPNIGYLGRWSGDRQFAQPANGSITYSDQPGASFQFSFKGSQLTWVYTRAFNRGLAEVSIDGVRRGVIDLYSPQTRWQSRTVFADLPTGAHTVHVRVLGEKAPAAAACFVDVDLLVVK